MCVRCHVTCWCVWMSNCPYFSTILFPAAKALIECGIEKGMISPSYRLYGHRDAKPTEYPGDKLYNEIKKWKNFGKTNTLLR